MNKLPTLLTSNRITSLATFPALILIWQGFSYFGLLDSRLVPSPFSVSLAFHEMISSGELVRDIMASSTRVLAGLLCGVIFGFVCGVGTGRFPAVSGSLGQILSGFRPVPAIAIIPFVIIWVGVGEAAKIMIVCWAVLFPVWIATHIGVRRVDEKYIWAAKSIGASKSQILLLFVVPSALPLITTGIRTGIGLAFISLFAAEMAGSIDGIGYRIFTSHLVFRVDKMIVALIALGLLGALVDYAFTFFARKAFPWMYHETRTT